MADIREVIRQLNEDVFGRGRVDLIDDIVHEDFVDHTPLQGMAADREGLKSFVQAVRGSMSDIDVRLERVVVEGDNVAWRWGMSGTHTGEFMGVPASGNRVEMTGNDLGVMRDGKLAEMWGEMDGLSLMTQLGAIQAPPQ